MKNVIYLLCLILFTGCEHFLKEYSQDLVVVKDVSDLDEVLLGSAYIPSFEQKTMNVNGDYCPWLNYLDDDINTVISAKANYVDVSKNLYGYTTWQLEVGRDMDGRNLQPDDFTWNNLYYRINVTNILLEEAKDIDIKQESDRVDLERIKGECYFLRAQFYLILVNLYANAYVPGKAETTLGVPLKLTAYVEHDKDKDVQFERASVAAVYEQIVEDLQMAVACLTASPQGKPLHRASKEAALLLLSRVYLYMQDWDNARKMAEQFLDARGYLQDMALMEEGEAFLQQKSVEVVFSQGSMNVSNSIRGYAGEFCVSRNLFDLYDETDYRVGWYYQHPLTDSLWLNGKYPVGNMRSHISDCFMLRNAEGYLNMAEACAMLGDDKANDWLNELRRNRIEGYEARHYSGDELIRQVREERRKELCFEGHRWFDLRRYAASVKLPFKKEIRRVFAAYDELSGDMSFLHAEVFVLQEDDLAYTFRIPVSVLKRDKGMPDNPREARTAVEIIR